MESLEQNHAEAELNDAVGGLNRWFQHKNSDSITIHNMRSSDFAQANEKLKRIIESLPEESKLLFTNGREALWASKFYKGAYDFYTEVCEQIEPGEKLAFEATHDWGDDQWGWPGLWFRSGALEVNARTLAEALQAGAEISIVPTVDCQDARQL